MLFRKLKHSNRCSVDPLAVSNEFGVKKKTEKIGGVLYYVLRVGTYHYVITGTFERNPRTAHRFTSAVTNSKEELVPDLEVCGKTKEEDKQKTKDNFFGIIEVTH